MNEYYQILDKYKIILYQMRVENVLILMNYTILSVIISFSQYDMPPSYATRVLNLLIAKLHNFYFYHLKLRLDSATNNFK